MQCAGRASLLKTFDRRKPEPSGQTWVGGPHRRFGVGPVAFVIFVRRVVSGPGETLSACLLSGPLLGLVLKAEENE